MKCNQCGTSKSKIYSLGLDGNYCLTCLDELYVKCHCGFYEDKEHTAVDPEGNIFCAKCFSEYAQNLHSIKQAINFKNVLTDNIMICGYLG